MFTPKFIDDVSKNGEALLGALDTFLRTEGRITDVTSMPRPLIQIAEDLRQGMETFLADLPEA